jgi:hypothetical protein
MAVYDANGFVTVTTAGTLVRLTLNLPVPTARVGAQSVQIQAKPGNSGPIYVGLAGFVRSTGVGLLAIIPKPASATTGPFASQSFSMPLAATGFDVSHLYLDADNDGDGAVVSWTVG